MVIPFTFISNKSRCIFNIYKPSLKSALATTSHEYDFLQHPFVTFNQQFKGEVNGAGSSCLKFKQILNPPH